MNCNLYRHYNKDSRLLYVGISASVPRRLVQHFSTSEWAIDIARVEIERFPFRWLAQEAEKTAIMVERPLFNMTYNNTNFTRVKVKPVALKPLPADFKQQPEIIGTDIFRPRGRPLASKADQALEKLKPWIAAGMSRRTWFRRQAEQRAKVKP